MNAWERQKCDTATSFDRFQRYYLAQNIPRSVDEAYRRWYADKYGAGTEQARKAPGIWRKWAWPADGQSWPERARAFDDHLAALRQAEWERRHMSKAELLARLADEARASIGDFLIIEYEQIADEEGNEQTVVKSAQIDFEIVRQKGALIQSLTWTRYGPKIELYDAQAAKVHLGKAMGLFKDGLELSGKDGAPIPITIIEPVPPSDNDE